MAKKPKDPLVHLRAGQYVLSKEGSAAAHVVAQSALRTPIDIVRFISSMDKEKWFTKAHVIDLIDAVCDCNSIDLKDVRPL